MPRDNRTPDLTCTAVRCRNAFETACVHANGDVVCSIIDGRGDFPLGNVYKESLSAIFDGARYRKLRQLVLSTDDSYCRAIGKHCPLKVEPVRSGEIVPCGPIRFLQIEPTTACDLRCLGCLVRDFDPSIGLRAAFRDGGVAFSIWDGGRRLKHLAADAACRFLPGLRRLEPWQLGRTGAFLLRRSVGGGRTGLLPLDALRRVAAEAGPAVERVDLFNYGEPFLYPPLLDALRHIRAVMPETRVVVSTHGMGANAPVEDALIDERLLDWLIFSIDGADGESYRRYRVRGQFEVAFRNLTRVHGKAAGTGLHVVWQYVVFRWNDSDTQLQGALERAERLGLTIWFDFARSTWGRSRRKARDLQYLMPHLRPETDLPT